MTSPWLKINRQSKHTRLIIPGWSILPNYFSGLFPKDNLIILNPFIVGNDQVKQYCNQINEEITIINQPIETILQSGIDQVFIFSMGLQWVDTHANELYEFPCDIVSPAISYHENELDHMIKSLEKSKMATLKAFFRQCFQSSSEWQWWKKQEFDSQIQFTNSDSLITWLDEYGRKSVSIPDKKSITIWLDPNDPIGIKPVVNQDNLSIKIHSNGHIVQAFEHNNHVSSYSGKLQK